MLQWGRGNLAPESGKDDLALETWSVVASMGPGQFSPGELSVPVQILRRKTSFNGAGAI